MRDYTNSLALYERARKVTPGGGQTASKSPGRVGPIGGYPLYLKSGCGCIVIDVDDNRYIDWFNGNCAVILGHECARNDQITLPSLPSRLEVEVAEQLCEVIPCAESVRFVKTGSEACAAAVRIARMATDHADRQHVTTVLVSREGYHGWHDWFQVTKPNHPGIPDAIGEVVETFAWGDLNDLKRALHNGVALVMLEPSLGDHPPDGYLQAVVDLAHAHGALVCFDEMITGGRYALAGGQELYGVTPDLATFGKSFGNGVPFAFVCGSREIMQHAWAISGTFGGDTLGLAACQSMLDAYRQERVIEWIWRVGQQLQDGFNGIAARLHAPVSMVGVPCRPRLRWDDESPAVISLWQQELAERGVLTHPSGWNPSGAHDAEAVVQTLNACQGALIEVLAAIQAGDVRARIRGELILPAFVQRKIA